MNHRPSSRPLPTRELLARLLLMLLTPLAGCKDSSPPPPAAAESTPTDATSSGLSAEQIEQSLAAAQEYLATQDIAKAKAILLTLVERAPNEVRAKELLGQTFILAAQQADQRRDAPAARTLRTQAYEQYKAAVALQPNSAGLHHSAGLMALTAGEPDAALGHFQAAGKLDPSSAQHPLFEAQLLIQKQRLDEAQAALERVLAIDPDEATAHASLAMIALERQQFDAALKHIAEARRIHPADIGMRGQQAKIHRRMNEPKKALELLIGVGPADRAREDVAFEIAASYDLLGEHIKAARAWEHVYKTNPVAPKAWLAMVHAGESLLKAGEREQAYMLLQQAKLAAPNEPEIKALEERIGE
jgi:protein O-GlcNAc transferase